MTSEEAIGILEKSKKYKIEFCEKYNLPIPTFESEEDYKIYPLEHYGINPVKECCSKCPKLEKCVTYYMTTNLYIRCIHYGKLANYIKETFLNSIIKELKGEDNNVSENQS